MTNIILATHSGCAAGRYLCRLPANTWRKQQRPALAQRVAEPWQEALQETFEQHKRGYGTRRLRVELQAQPTGARWAASAYCPPTTDYTHELHCAPNRLLDQPKPVQPNQGWVSIITYRPLASEQWAYAPFGMPTPGR